MPIKSSPIFVCLLLTLTCFSFAEGDEPTVEDAIKFIEQAENRLQELWIRAGRAGWVQANFITVDTERLAAHASKEVLAATVELAKEATKYSNLDLPSDAARKMKLLRTSLSLIAPDDSQKQTELAQIAAEMESIYGSGKYCPEGPDSCQDLGALSRTMARSQDPQALLGAWQGWRTISPPIKPKYERFVQLGNEGARELGFADLGEMWRAHYDMPPDDFTAEVDRLWSQVKPLYDSLHCYVRAKLADKYGKELVDPTGPIPAHLLGNMWAQQWGNIYQLVAPPEGGIGYDLTKILEDRKIGAREMVKYGEKFFTSLGFEPLPKTFWERSLFTEPRDREVVCHASAWNLDAKDDLRIKMCIEPTAEDFITIHHELGHNIYQRAYNQQPPFFQAGAHDGFHEGIGDTVALSITPEYLNKVGLLETVPRTQGDLGFLMRNALDKVAFLPFGLLVDQWRWKVFSGKITPSEYNQGWWDLREKYQGIKAPVERNESDFDPGAKYHIPANTPYTRYFLAHILQFQFHRALCEKAGYQGPLHRCSVYASKEAGESLNEMLKTGSSQPWPDALATLTGEREMDATAIIDYFAPLMEWLEEQNQGRQCGW